MGITGIAEKENGVVLQGSDGLLSIEFVGEQIVRMVYTKETEIKAPSTIITDYREEVSYLVEESAETISVETDSIRVLVDNKTEKVTFFQKNTGNVYVKEAGKVLTKKDVIKYTTGDEAPLIERVKTVDGERNFIRNLKPTVDRTAYRGKLYFDWQEGEAIHGLGQAEEGIYDYRGNNQYLYQHNMRIPIPFFVSTNCYGILFDCASLMTFNDDAHGSYVFLDTVDQMDYYFIGGSYFDEIMDGYRKLTGTAVMLPKWSFGYVQSKEAYHTGEELVETVAKYRSLEVPIDCIVQDWNTWEPGNWGQKTVDKGRYPNLAESIQKIHAMNVHTMVSVWPNMNPGGKNHQEFFEKGYLLNDYSTYNAFDEKAREVYWKQANEELFSSGFDSWWCDSTEPFSGPDWGGEVKKEAWERFSLVGEEHKQYLDATQANLFACEHAKGIFENQRKTTEEKRVLNLTRSGYASSQRYGTVLWSGDISANWDTLRKQIIEGLNFAMSGMPYWTLDIGAFFTVGTAWQKRGCNCQDNPNPLWFWKGEYNDGVLDNGYKELYVRWLEYGTFLPMFRSHGTDTPREIWNFGKKGEMFYDAIEKFIQLRYRLMPYIYSLAGDVYRNNGTIYRSLLFDFLQDPMVKDISDEFMFGKSILVCPVTSPMYFEANNQKIDKKKTKTCYLPAGCNWFDYFTDEKKEGGQWIEAAAPIDQIPLFVKEGAIIPMQSGLSYANEKVEGPMDIKVYPGVDGSFELYEDEGDGYRFEQGEFSLIPFTWTQKTGTLTIGKRTGGFQGMKEERVFRIICESKEYNLSYSGEVVEIELSSL